MALILTLHRAARIRRFTYHIYDRIILTHTVKKCEYRSQCWAERTRDTMSRCALPDNLPYQVPREGGGIHNQRLGTPGRPVQHRRREGVVRLGVHGTPRVHAGQVPPSTASLPGHLQRIKVS